ncbi:glutathione S-transferase N-terminal domain-containing protein [Methylobacterium sp. WL8]|uniref:glutathione S-transferase family protein n=1 Tax=Methylobacterium sp. WL8 TaxID=2603899 RepID=UPI0011C9B238|nr:glutathione S-transferase N-terminal domain-containing protein [Methylobacterium sp. WL8]TXN84257.1 glutathione S-transferase [Methylobacterium sp. WL8]
MPTTTDAIVLHHAPNTRSTGVRVLLEELGAPHDLHVINLKAGEQQGSAHLAVNPMGKVPAIRHGAATVAEQAACYLYLADLFPEAGLAPALTDPARGAYLRWMVFYGSCFEPAVIDRAMERDPPPRMMSAYGDYDTVLSQVIAMLTPGPWILGERFSATDVLWGSALGWTTAFKLVPEEPAIMAYLARYRARPAYQAISADDARLAAAQQESAPG